jgi:hypothetical protein
VRVTVEGSLGVAVLRLVACEIPDDQGLVSAARQKHVGAVPCQFKGSIVFVRGESPAYFSIEVAKLVTQPFYIKCQSHFES